MSRNRGSRKRRGRRARSQGQTTYRQNKRTMKKIVSERQVGVENDNRKTNKEMEKTELF
jgi:hypothetical protein